MVEYTAKNLTFPNLVELFVPESNHSERVLGTAGNVLALLVGELAGRVHGLLLAGVQEAGAVGQQDPAGQRLKHSPE